MIPSFLGHFGLSEDQIELVGERFYSTVYRMIGKDRVAKLATSHRRLQPHGFCSMSEATGFAHQIMEYVEKLEKIGVPVASARKTSVSVLSAHDTGEPFVVIRVPDGGVSVETLMEDGDQGLLRELAQGMVKGFSQVLSQYQLIDGYPEVGIDPVPSNFAKHPASAMTYIDFTPPRYYSADCGHRVEYPQPVSEVELAEARFRYYDPRGIAIRWFTDCCRIKPDGRNIFIETLRGSISEALWGLVKNELPSLDLPADVQTPEWREAILKTMNLGHLRDMACVVATAIHDDLATARQWLNVVFELSRHHPGQMIAAHEQLDALKAHLLGCLAI